MSKLLEGIAISVSGSHKGHTQRKPFLPPHAAKSPTHDHPAQIERLVKKHGGIFSKTVEDTTTHLISNSADVSKGPLKGTYPFPSSPFPSTC
jgi:hypothetical protein